MRTAYNSIDTIASIALREGNRGLLCATGTLCYYQQADLEMLLRNAFDLKLDVAFSEPNTVGEESLQQSLRRTTTSWYHPYLAILRGLGYRLPDQNGQQIRDSVSTYAEERTFVFAQNPNRASRLEA